MANDYMTRDTNRFFSDNAADLLESGLGAGIGGVNSDAGRLFSSGGSYGMQNCLMY